MVLTISRWHPIISSQKFPSENPKSFIAKIIPIRKRFDHDRSFLEPITFGSRIGSACIDPDRMIHWSIHEARTDRFRGSIFSAQLFMFRKKKKKFSIFFSMWIEKPWILKCKWVVTKLEKSVLWFKNKHLVPFDHKFFYLFLNWIKMADIIGEKHPFPCKFIF